MSDSSELLSSSDEEIEPKPVKKTEPPPQKTEPVKPEEPAKEEKPLKDQLLVKRKTGRPSVQVAEYTVGDDNEEISDSDDGPAKVETDAPKAEVEPKEKPKEEVAAVTFTKPAESDDDDLLSSDDDDGKEEDIMEPPKEEKKAEPVAKPKDAEEEVESSEEVKKEATPEPAKEPTPEPAKEPTPEPAKEPTPEPEKEPTPEPEESEEEATPEPVKEPTPEPEEESEEEVQPKETSEDFDVDSEEEEEEVKSETKLQNTPMRTRTTSLYQEHNARMNQMEEKARLDRKKAMENNARGTTTGLFFASEQDKVQKLEQERQRRKREEEAKKKADVKSSIEDTEARLTEFKKAKEKVKAKKKTWKPKCTGYMNFVTSPMKLKKSKDHVFKKSKGLYCALDRLPSTCNIDETEAEWTKNKKADILVPAIVAFATKRKYEDFVAKVKKNNMRLSKGLMPLAVHACGMFKLTDVFTVEQKITDAIDELKKILETDAVLPVDSFRGGDTGESSQLTICQAKNALVVTIEDGYDEWMGELKSLSKESTQVTE